MFGFGKKKPDAAAPLPPLPLASTLPPLPIPDDGNPVNQAIARFRQGDPIQFFKILEGLPAINVTLLVQKAGDWKTSAFLEWKGVPHLIVFTVPNLAREWPSRAGHVPLEMPLSRLCVTIPADADMGLAINPDHPALGFNVPSTPFKNVRKGVRDARPALKEGGLYFTSNEDGSFSVLKILKLDEHGVHIRQYSNKYPAPPSTVDTSTLYIAGMDRRSDEGLGAGHLPISKDSFAGWNAVFFQQDTVSDEELDGFRIWQENNGGYFG